MEVDHFGIKKIYLLLHNVFNESPIGIFITDRNGTIEFVNQTICRITEFSRNELIGQNPRILKSGVHSQAYYKNMWDTIMSGNSWNNILCNKKKSGELYWEQQYIFPIKDNKNNISRFIAIKTDITQQKKYEEQLLAAHSYLNNIFLALPVLLFIITTEGIITEVMAKDEILLYVERKSVLNRNIKEIFPPEKAKIFEDFIKNTVKSEEGQTLEYSLETLKGLRWFEARSGLLKDEKNNKIIVVVVDITDRKLYEKKLKELIATKDKFFSIIAHDLRNPLQAIMAIAEMLYSRHYTPEGVNELAKMLYDSGQSAFELLENLLEWSRSQIGTIHFNPSKQNLYEIVDDTINILLNQAQYKNISLYNTIEKNIEWNIDSNLLKTVIRNLVSNAIKFTPEGGFIKIWSESLPDKLRICVEDNGRGINPDILPTLFTTSTSSTAGTKNEKGSGLGLLLCKELITIHKGNIYVESVEKKGSKFFIELPA